MLNAQVQQRYRHILNMRCSSVQSPVFNFNKHCWYIHNILTMFTMKTVWSLSVLCIFFNDMYKHWNLAIFLNIL